ncbi:MAG: class I SAM-dependent methyltransferase [Acidimicrobiales bacterium]
MTSLPPTQPDDPRRRWNARYSRRAAAAGDPAPFLRSIESHLPTTGSALDVGGGLGANSVWLAERGMNVTLLDVSDEALAQAREMVIPRGVGVEFLRRDVETDGLPPESRSDLVLMHLFLARGVVSDIGHHLAVGGVFALCQPTVVNLERHPKPSARFLLREGEVEEIGARMQREGWATVVEASDAWRESGRHDGWLVVKRRAS